MFCLLCLAWPDFVWLSSPFLWDNGFDSQTVVVDISLALTYELCLVHAAHRVQEKNNVGLTKYLFVCHFLSLLRISNTLVLS